MHAASGVHVGQVGRVEPRLVRMPGDERDAGRQGKVGQPFFNQILVAVILCGAGRVKHAEALQRTPEIADQKAAAGVQGEHRGVPESLLKTGMTAH